MCEACLAPRLRHGDGDFSEVRLTRLQVTLGRECENIGGAIDAAMAPVQGSYGMIGSQEKSHAGFAPVGRLEQPLQKAPAVGADAAAARILQNDLYRPHRRVCVGCSRCVLLLRKERSVTFSNSKPG